MLEMEINRSNHLIDPQLQIWGWEIPVYLFLGGVTAGLMVFAALLGWRTSPAERSRWGRWLPFVAPVLLSLGMLALLLDLELKRHVFRFYTAFLPSSPMSWGAWILVLIYPATILLGLAELTDEEAGRLAAFGPLRPLRGLLRWGRELGRRWLGGLRWANLGLGVALGGYTGLLLGTLGARPAWSSVVLGPLFLVSGVSTGAALSMLLPLSRAEHGQLRRYDIGAILLEVALIALFLLGLSTGGEAARQAADLFLGGRYTASFWSLVVVAGLVVPLTIEGIESLRGLRPSLAAPLFLLFGGLCLRFIVVWAGQA